MLEELEGVAEKIAEKLIKKNIGKKGQGCRYTLEALKEDVVIRVESDDMTLCHENFKTFKKLVTKK